MNCSALHPASGPLRVTQFPPACDGVMLRQGESGRDSNTVIKICHINALEHSEINPVGKHRCSKRSSGQHQKAGSGQEGATVFITTSEIKVWCFLCVCEVVLKTAKRLLLALGFILNKWLVALLSIEKELWPKLRACIQLNALSR